VFAHIGGRPYGMQFDKDENLIVCVGGMGVYGVKPSGEVFKVTDETSRTWTKLNDDSRVRMADDLDIAPDGKIYFSDCTPVTRRRPIRSKWSRAVRTAACCATIPRPARRTS
jgi:ribose transport system permease protein